MPARRIASLLIIAPVALALTGVPAWAQTQQCPQGLGLLILCALFADQDSDGSTTICCGGGDCDDLDPGRFPGNTEICDLIDQDCNPATVGSNDLNRDRFVDAACCNTIPGTGQLQCGRDCDDGDAFINPISAYSFCVDDLTMQWCDPSGEFIVSGCDPGFVCVTQPHGGGVCQEDHDVCKEVDACQDPPGDPLPTP